MTKIVFNLSQYKQWLKSLSCDDIKDIIDKHKLKYYSKWNESYVQIIDNAFGNIFHYVFYANEKYKAYISDLKSIELINDYLTSNNFYWDLLVEDDDSLVISYSNTKVFTFKRFVQIIPEFDYKSLTPTAIKNLLLHDNCTYDTSMLPTELTNLSLNDSYSNKETLDSKIDLLKQQIEDVKNNKNEELLIIQKEIDAKMAELRAKKESLMNTLNDKMSEFQTMLEKLKNQIFMLKTEIYSIRCFAGETVELIQIRDGKNADIELPIVLNQKILYLDEDLARTVSIYQDDITEKFSLLEEALKYNDIVRDMFCPQEKSISFFKLSKTGESYDFDVLKDMMECYKILHASKIGFVVRNGENLYVGWLEEDWDKDTSDRNSHKLTFNDNVIFKADSKIIETNDDTHIEQTDVNTAVSRFFAINVLQGLIEHKNILSIPEKENILQPNKYIIHNYADAWLDDNRYGNFATLVHNLHKYNKQNDVILVIQPMSERNQNPYQANRSRGDRNMTRDCHVMSGLNKINLIENNEIYVSAKKEDNWDGTPRRNSNFSINTSEFVNITFMNSNWMKYYIDTKKIGAFNNLYSRWGSELTINYSYMVRYFNIAYYYLKDREKIEYELISKYYDNLDNIDWLDLLSHWKIYNDVRVITPFQAKRFAKYLNNKKYYKIKDLFTVEFTNINNHDVSRYYYKTVLSDVSNASKYCTKNDRHPEFGNDVEESNICFNRKSNINDIKSREVTDERKLNFIKEDLLNLLITYNININDKLLKKQLLNVNNNFKLAYPTTWELIVNKPINHDFINDTHISNTFIWEMDHSKYRWLCNTHHDLKKLVYMRYLQQYYYDSLETCIYNVINNANYYIVEYES